MRNIPSTLKYNPIATQELMIPLRDLYDYLGLTISNYSQYILTNLKKSQHFVEGIDYAIDYEQPLRDSTQPT